MSWTTKPFEESLPKVEWVNIVKPVSSWQPDKPFMEALEERLHVEMQKPNLHDPYLNPNAQLVYECADCPELLDPGTKSFASLNNAASNAGWKVRWGEIGYNAFCEGCAKLRGLV